MKKRHLNKAGKSEMRKGTRNNDCIGNNAAYNNTAYKNVAMSVAEQIEMWLDDEAFVAFANERMNEMLRRYHHVDSVFEEMDEGFDEEDAYIVPMMEYLSCRLHKALLCKNKRRREQEVWWVWYEVAMQGYYVQLFMPYYETLVEELRLELMPMIHREYMQRKEKK